MKKGDMMADEEYPEGSEEHVMFACPECGKEIANDVSVCPGCGAMFEEEEAPPSTSMEEGQMAPPSDYVEGQGLPNQSAEEELGLPPETAEEELGPSSPYPEEEQIAPPESDLADNESEELDTPMDSDTESSLLAETEGPPRDVKSDMRPPQKSIPEALSDYSERRKKRNLYGALFLGLGIVLFVLLWLVVVYDVLVTETKEWFGVDVILILVGAGILFILGLYLILSYPKSSLSELLSTMATTRPTTDSGIGTDPSSKYNED
jgi:hypothetical protein